MTTIKVYEVGDLVYYLNPSCDRICKGTITRVLVETVKKEYESKVTVRDLLDTSSEVYGGINLSARLVFQTLSDLLDFYEQEFKQRYNVADSEALPKSKKRRVPAGGNS